MESLYIMVTAIVAWLILCVVMWRLHRAKQHINIATDASVLIVYSSQTGNALTIANRCAQALNLSEMSDVLPLNNLSIEHLSRIKKVLFVLSTYGDGEAPDNGNLFNDRLTQALDESITLEQVNYSVIALGDSSYPDFCAFGHQVNNGLKALKAQPLSELITLDNYDEETTRFSDIIPAWLDLNNTQIDKTQGNSSYNWQLVEREVLNPNCGDELLVKIGLKCLGATPIWQAGDLIDIQPRNSVEIVENWLLKHVFDGSLWLAHQGHQQPLSAWLLERELPEKCYIPVSDLLTQLPYLAKRSYSIASVTENKQLELIIRLLQKDDKSFGLASSFLSHHCKIGELIEGKIRSVKAHHIINNTQPIILIGSGSGLAGLKAQIAARTYAQQSLNENIGAMWLIYGERRNDSQLPINQHLFSLKDTQIDKLSCTYSQGNNYPKYVQDILVADQYIIKKWLDEGAIIYVCGCLSGMGESVHQTLIDTLGQKTLDDLQQEQRYIRDVY
ncbi:flavodoxin domain-containing protein [Pseudocolwellia sp. HL-MZ19]|uniref:flavodoxin domain-containing protein n=1 Tax=Pseudocolwellia sp. HL-MZ19 TaxID=3400846 RepID=UPI003CE96E74